MCYADPTKANIELRWKAKYGEKKCVKMRGDGKVIILMDM